jgi:hypothetical protein
MKSFEAKRQQVTRTKDEPDAVRRAQDTEQGVVSRQLVSGLASGNQRFPDRNDTGIPDGLKAGIEHLLGLRSTIRSA